MRLIIFITCVTLFKTSNPMPLYQTILNEFDNSYNEIESPYGFCNANNANYFPTLEHGFYMIATPSIHLYRQNDLWGIVFEQPGVSNKQFAAMNELYYFGNNIEFSHFTTFKTNYIWEYPINLKAEWLESDELKIIAEDKNGNPIPYSKDLKVYKEMGILNKFEGGMDEIGLEEIFLFIAEKHPELVELSEEKIQSHFKSPMKKIMTIKSYNYISVYLDDFLPSSHETFQLLAKVVAENDSSLWKPTLPPNNHWSNWTNGHM